MPFPVIVSDHSAICLIGGARIDPMAFFAVLERANSFVAVDSGADFLLEHGVTPQAVIGDMDSISARARALFADRICHISEQSTTDFEKALSRISAPLILALGFTGGRLDHMLSVLNVMARFPDRGVVLVDATDASFALTSGETVFHLPAGTRISVMPLGVAAGVSLSGVQWDFTDQTMTPDGFTSPSNAASGGDICLRTDGPVLVTLPLAQLDCALQAASRG